MIAAGIWDYWEDYQHGLYTPGSDPARVAASARLLGDPDCFWEVAREMVRAWPNSARHNLTNLWTGRNAWIGQASCCYSHKATSSETREAWGTLTQQEQRRANDIARGVRDLWEKGQRDAQTLFAD